MSEILNKLPVRTVISSRPVFKRYDSKYLAPAPRPLRLDEHRKFSTPITSKLVSQPLVSWNLCPNKKLSARKRNRIKLSAGTNRTFKTSAAQRKCNDPCDKKKPDVDDITGSWRTDKKKKFPRRFQFFLQPKDGKPCEEEPAPTTVKITDKDCKSQTIEVKECCGPSTKGFIVNVAMSFFEKKG